MDGGSRENEDKGELASKQQHLNHGAVWVSCVYIMGRAGRERHDEE